MKVSILAAAAAAVLGASGVSASALAIPSTATIDIFGEPGCTDTNNFLSINVAADNACHNIGPFLDNGARLASCTAAFQCRCTVYKNKNCDASAGDVQINYEDGRSQDCAFTGGGFLWNSAVCTVFRVTGSG